MAACACIRVDLRSSDADSLHQVITLEFELSVLAIYFELASIVCSL
jgi:hypothetical protein